MSKLQLNESIHTQSTARLKAGWSIAEWCESVNLSRATLYTLSPESQPKSVKVGKRRIITERPDDFLSRLARQSAEQAEAA